MLGRDVVDSSASRHGHNAGRISGLVAANVGSGWVFDALFAIFVLGNARYGPVLIFSFSVNDELGESVYVVSMTVC